jgi:N-glycosidase YbiA
MTIYFYSTRDDFGCFSNFSDHGFTLEGKYWPTSEHFFQAQKFAGTKWEELIRGCPSPREAANMGRKRELPLRPDWESVKIPLMKAAVLAKFRAHESIRAILLGTGNEEIVENAPNDFFWGCGKDGSGKNMLGRILMEVRDELRIT